MLHFAEFAERWRQKYPAMIDTWERAWAEFVPYLEFPIELRTIVCTTDGGPPVDRSRWLRGLFGLGVAVLVFPLDGWHVAEARVEPPVVVGVDPGEDGPAGGGPVREPVAVHDLALE